MLAATTAWWLVGVGLLCILAAWFYTGGSRPYGYLGLGEVMVFVFFGLVAVIGTTYVQTETFELPALYAAVGIGALACAILVANNLRDIPTDKVAGKRTLAVALGDERTRHLYGFLIDAAVVALIGVALTTTWWALLALAAGRPRPRASPTVLGDKATGPGLVPVLQQTGIAELLYAAGILAGLDDRRGHRVCLRCNHAQCHTGDMWFFILVGDPGRLRAGLRQPGPPARQDARPVRDPDQPAAQAQAALTVSSVVEEVAQQPSRNHWIRWFRDARWRSLLNHRKRAQSAVLLGPHLLDFAFRLRAGLRQPRHPARQDARSLRDPHQPAAQAQAWC